MQLRCEVTKDVRSGRRAAWVLGLLLGLVLASPGNAGTYGAFGPETFVRAAGSPSIVERTFTAVDAGAAYTLRVENGGGSGEMGNVSSAVVTLNGVDVVRTNEFNQNVTVIEKPVTLRAGQNRLIVDLRSSPASGFKLMILGVDDVAPTIAATLSPAPNAAGWNNSDVTVSFQCADERSGVGFCPDPVVVSREGAGQVVSGTVFDLAGNRKQAVVTVNLDKTGPAVAFVAPEAGQSVNVDSVLARATATDANGVVAAELGGSPVPVVDGAFEGRVALAEGSNSVAATARDAAGNAGTASVEVVRFTLPEVTISAPAPQTLTAAPTAQVTGTVSPGVTEVEVNGVAAALSGTAFTAANVPLFEGNNLLTVVASGAGGRSATASVQVIRDSTAPRVAIHAPAAGFLTTAATVTVSGMVNDLIVGSLDPAEAQVTVNGVSAEVANRNFVAADVPLALGDNTLTATARDLSGNVGTASVTVRREAPAGPRIAAVSGDLQEGTIGSALPQPLVVAVTDGAGAPLAGRQVTFRVVENNGTAENAAGSGPVVIVTTNAQGRAQTVLTLGTRAGAGKNRVEATSPGIAGVAVFTASGAPAGGAKVSVDAGNLQFGVAGQELPRPLVAVVTDDGHNRLPGVPVTFRVVAGGGSFGGQETATVETDAYGRALSALTLGPDAGEDNNLVEATFAGNPGGPAVFAASGRVAGDPADTRIRGVVLDNSDQPIPGVTVKVEEHDLVTRTDAQGQFTIAQAPVGRVRLVVDGSTAQRPGSWPSLEYEMVTVAGADNDVGMPVYLLPLDLPNGVYVTETQGGTLTLPHLPGFSLEIAPGSATFPGGGKSGLVSVTLVHSDKVPMIPNFGQQPRFIITIQPSGVRFDPPARMSMPNVDGLAPGQVTEMYSFDHDLGMFVSIGTATVSPDGSVIRSDPGVGVVEGGWHCGGNPAAAGGAQNASVTINTADPFKMKKDETKTVAASGGPQPGTYSWTVDKPDMISFQGPTSGPNASSVPIKALKGGTAKVKVTYTCESGASDTDEIKVVVAGPDIVVVAWVDAGPAEAARQALEGSAGWYLKLDLHSIMCNPTLGLWTLGVPIDLLNDNDRRYANAFLLANSGNARPPQNISPEAVQAGGDYRLFGRYQVAIEDIAGPVVETIQQASQVGITPNPCGWGPNGSPDIHPDNGRNGLTGSRTAAANLTSGRLGSEGQSANQTINGHSTPWIWNVIRFNLDAQLDPASIDRAIFPTYTLYEDGQQINNFPQANHEQFIALDDTYQRRWTDIP